MKATEFDYGCVPTHAEKLRELAGTIQEGTKKITHVGIVIGDAYRSAKDTLDRGTFSKWCAAETSHSLRKAELYMNLAALFHRLGNDGKDLLLLPLTGALELARPSVEEVVITEILSRARRGERLTVEFVKEFVRGKPVPSEPGPEGSDEVASMFAGAVNAQQKSRAREYFGPKPRAHDRSFMKRLRSHLFEEAPETETRSKQLMLRELSAA